MKNLLFSLLFLFGFIELNGQTYTQIDYAEDTTNFPNPERGFYHSETSVNYNALLSYRSEGITLIFRTYQLGSFKNRPISTYFLRNMQHDFDILRKAGAKVVVRFSYTDKSTPPYGDAPPEIVLMHVRQLKPILLANSDVILVLQAGFIGAWGEWFYTDYYSVSPGVISEQNWADRRELVDSLLTAIPINRMIQVRTPEYKFKLLNMNSYQPVTPQEAYSTLPVARIAHHNDCFVAGPSDYGTYHDSTIEKPYLAQDSKYTIVGGETCNKCAQSTCSNAVKELRRFHWTFLNIDYNGSVLNEWREQGCFPKIQKKLGYRFRLINALLPNQSKPGGLLHLNLKLLNDGWANPTNPRSVEIILKNKNSGKEYFINPSGDMRFWPINDTIDINVEAGLPENIEQGDYNFFLNLPDGDTRLNDCPKYAIRLANDSVWDSLSGYNSLMHFLHVDTAASVSSYYGRNYFKEKNSIVPSNAHIIIDGDASDWANIPILYSANGQSAQRLKVYNTEDTLFLLVEGKNLSSDNEFLFNTDNDTSTGAFYGPWLHTGFDYMVEDNYLFRYFGTNHEFSWHFLNNVDIVQNTKVIELKIPFNQLNDPSIVKNFHLGIVNNYTSEDSVSYLPLATEDLIKVQKDNLTQSAIVKVKNYGSHNLIFWTRNLHGNDIYTVLQKAKEGQNFKTIGVFNNHEIVYKDDDLQENQTYQYRVQYKQGNDLSPFSDTAYITATQNSNRFVNIRLDGQPDDWILCPPSATGLINNKMASICFYNNQQKDSLYFSIQSLMNNYQLYFDRDNTGNFSVLISNDSLFIHSSGLWIFQKIIPSYRSNGFMESGVKMSQIGLDSVTTFNAVLMIDGRDVWGNNQHFNFMKYQPPSNPKYFKLHTLTNFTFSRIKINWFPNQHPDGYLIERSDGDSLHFETLADLSNTTFQYIDKNLDSSMTYFYRMFAYKDILRSGYTPVKWMQPGHPSGINSLTNHTASVKIVPNPVKQSAKISIDLDTRDEVRIMLFSVNGQKTMKLFHGVIWNKKTIAFEKGNLRSGYYILYITGAKTTIVKKIIIY